MLLPKIFFKAIALPTLILFFTSPQLLASDTSTPDSTANDAQRQRALQFRIAENLSLDSFLGSSVSLLFDLSSQTSLRLGAGITVKAESWDREDDGETERDEDQDYLGLNLQTHYLVSPKSSGSGRLYFGGGPWLNITWSNLNDKFSEVAGEERRVQIWIVGAKGIIGYSWRLGQRLGLFAEYHTLFSYRRSVTRQIAHYDTTADSEDVATYAKWSIEPGGALLGVSLYF